MSVNKGGEEEVVTTAAASQRHGDPQLLPGEENVLHVVSRGRVFDIAVTSTTTDERRVLFQGAFSPTYVATGHLLVAQKNVLLGMTFDPETLRVGRHVSVLKGLMTDASLGRAAYAVSEEGSLAYLTGALDREAWFIRVAPGEEPQRLHDRPLDLDYDRIEVSPEGGRIAASTNEGDIRIFDLERRDFTSRLTSSPAWDGNPVWHPSGKSLAFSSDRNGRSIFSRSADGLGEARLLVEDESRLKLSESFSPDGQIFLFTQLDPVADNNVWSVPFDRPADATPLLHSQFQEVRPAFSPDGKWVAYQSNESGEPEVYITSYPEKDIDRKISRGGGEFPRWSSTSERVFYQLGGRIMVVEALDSEFRPSDPETFVEGVDGVGLAWDVTPDGKSVIALESRPPPRLHLVQNWFEELKRLVPTD